MWTSKVYSPHKNVPKKNSATSRQLTITAPMQQAAIAVAHQRHVPASSNGCSYVEQVAQMVMHT
jgi:hypothetical protein